MFGVVVAHFYPLVFSSKIFSSAIGTDVGCGAGSSRSRDIIQVCLYPRFTIQSFPNFCDVCLPTFLWTHGIGLTVVFSHGISHIKEKHCNTARYGMVWYGIVLYCKQSL